MTSFKVTCTKGDGKAYTVALTGNPVDEMDENTIRALALDSFTISLQGIARKGNGPKEVTEAIDKKLATLNYKTRVDSVSDYVATASETATIKAILTKAKSKGITADKLAELLEGIN